ncbi:putative metalloprotease CJM1_0395 family protein [Marinobacter sp. F3R08]|uniref:putative metalloprotease CJM1_0395 family protein n=1 Tax=Marinobacter sp. F3R08 TaxID=2841559 RepID=UPI001C0A3CEC|nr:putative metalloprotease CJM1_0395 family protein [Marinobacter sp. F3R08]MBU2954553.1 hypothetical protein [Marinobacter sp. F3R08]
MLSFLPSVLPSFSGTSAQANVAPNAGTSDSATAEPGTPSSGGEPKGTSARAEPVRDTSESRSASQGSDNFQGLSDQELEQLTELKARDREVRAHEATHQAVGGQYAGAVSFTYQRGPDGAQYAVGGEVSIDLSPVQGDPQATIEKMRIVRAAAMAPAEPSGQDRAVAAEAMQILLQAQSELAVESGSSSSAASDTYRDVSAMGEDDPDGDENRATSFTPVSV